MSKVVTCDLCKQSVPVKGQEARPEGWSLVRVEHKRNGIGGTLIRLDVCPGCDKVDFSGGYDRAVAFVKHTIYSVNKGAL